MTTLHHPPVSASRDSRGPGRTVRVVSRPLALLIAAGTLLVGFLAGGIVGGLSASDAVEQRIALDSEIVDLEEQIELLESGGADSGGE